MASAIATPLEQQFAALPGLAERTSARGIGSTLVTLQFDLERNIDGAAQDVQQAINAATGLLPKDLPSPPTYRKTNPADRPVLIYAVHSDALPVYRIDDYAYTILAQKLSTVPGVAQSNVFGQKQYAVRVQADPAALAVRGLGLEDVRIAIAAASVNRPKGNIENHFQSVTVDTNDQIFDAAGFRELIVAYRGGAPVRLSDVATVTDSIQNARVGAWFMDTPAEGLSIQRAAGANTIEIVDTVRGLLPQLLESIPPAVQVDLVSDRSLVIRAAVHDVQLTMLLTIMLVVLVIFIFLRTLCATVIPSISVPLSLLTPFAVLCFLNFSLANTALMSLTISAGLSCATR